MLAASPFMSVSWALSLNLFISLGSVRRTDEVPAPAPLPLPLPFTSGAKQGFYEPVRGTGGSLRATIGGVQSCSGVYTRSKLEEDFAMDPDSKTNDITKLCDTFGERGESWIRQNMEKETPDLDIFSKMCVAGQKQKLIEPLAGILRDPRFLCSDQDQTSTSLLYSIDWLVFDDDDEGTLSNAGVKRFYDAGGTRFADACIFFLTKYKERGIEFDEVYVWEATQIAAEDYWAGTPPEVRELWEHKLTFYNGVPVTAEQGHDDNVVERIFRDCRAEDFCAFKLDIDTPVVEQALVAQLLSQSEKTQAALDEFFFEHHVHGLMENYGWLGQSDGTAASSYENFGRLRQLGVRAHSWI